MKTTVLAIKVQQLIQAYRATVRPKCEFLEKQVAAETTCINELIALASNSESGTRKPRQECDKMPASIATVKEEIVQVQQVLVAYHCHHEALSEKLEELESSKKEVQDEYSRLLPSLEVHRAESLARPLSDEELAAVALKEAQWILESQVAEIDA